MLGEELSVINAPALTDDLIPYRGQGLEKIVFDATKLCGLIGF